MTGDIVFKEKFLAEIDESYTDSTDASIRQYKIFFNNSVLKMKETLLGKDIYDFAEKEIEDFLYDLRVRNINTLAGYFTMLRKYLLYAQDKKVSVQSVNSVISYSRDDLKKYIDTTGEYEQYMTKNELKHFVFKKDGGDYIIQNAQERALYIVIYNGILGKQGIDLSDLLITDFDYKEKIILSNDRIIELEDWESDAINEAINENSYISYGKSMEYPYIQSPYVFKTIDRLKQKGGVEISDKVLYQTIAGRIRDCSRLINKPFWKAKSIFDSGVIYRMIKEKENWTATEIFEYKEKNNISINFDNIKRIMDIIQDKLDTEEISLDEVATTTLTVVK